MLVTIDSNIVNLPNLIAKKLHLKTRLWCTQVNKCPFMNNNNNDDMTMDDSYDASNQENHKKQTSSSSISNSLAIETQKSKSTNNNNITTTNGNAATNNTNKPKIFYNTPIGMSDNIKPYNFDKNPDAMYFIYLDMSNDDAARQRIIRNILTLPNPIVILNMNSIGGDLIFSKVHKYTISTGNCEYNEIADLLSGIISMHILVGRPVHQREIIGLLCNEVQNMDSLPPENQPKHYNIYEVLDAKNPKPIELNDCHDCS